MSPPQHLGTSEQAKSACVLLEVELQPGRYLVLLRGTVDRKRACALSLYSSGPVTGVFLLM